MKKRERQEKRFLDVVKENMESVSVTEEGATDRVKWREMTHCGDP